MRFIEFSSASGGQPLVVVAEAEPAPAPTGEQPARESELPADAAVARVRPQHQAGSVASAEASLEGVIAGVRQSAEALIAGLRGLGPDEVSVQYGIKLDAQAGAVITPARGDAHFIVELAWRADRQ